MVRDILKKMKPAQLRKYIAAHNKVVRQYIGVEIKQARAAYSENLKIKRREMKAAQTIDAKGKKKEQLIELIMREPSLVRKIKFDDDNKTVDPPAEAPAATGGGAAQPKPKAKPKEDIRKSPPTPKVLDIKEKIKKKAVEIKKDRIQSKVKALGKSQVAKKRELASKIEKTAESLKKAKPKPKKKIDVTAELAKIDSGSAKKPSEDNEKKYVKLLIKLENIPIKIRNAGVTLEDEYDLEALEDDIASGAGSQASVLKNALKNLEDLIKQPLMIFRSTKKIESDIAKFVPNYKKDPRFNKAIKDIENAQDKYNKKLTVLKTKIVKKIGAKKSALKPEEKPKAQAKQTKPEPKKEAPKPKAKPKAKPAAKQKKYNFNFMKNLKFSNNSSENNRKTEKEIRKNLTILDIKKLCGVYYEKKDYKTFFKMTENLEGEEYEELVTDILFELCEEQDFDERNSKVKAKPKAKPEEEEEEQSVAGPIKKVPKKLHSIWKEYMEYKVGDWYSPKDQKEEIEELVDGQKQFLEARKKRKSGNLSAAEQSKQIIIIASFSDAMRDEFNENEGFKKIYKEFAPKLLEDYEESTKAPKKPKKQKKEEVDPETAKQLARFAGRFN